MIRPILVSGLVPGKHKDVCDTQTQYEIRLSHQSDKTDKKNNKIRCEMIKKINVTCVSQRDEYHKGKFETVGCVTSWFEMRLENRSGETKGEAWCYSRKFYPSVANRTITGSLLKVEPFGVDVRGESRGRGGGGGWWVRGGVGRFQGGGGGRGRGGRAWGQGGSG